MGPILLDLPYKADRNYLHGTDMYDAIVHCVAGTAPEALNRRLELLFRKVCRHQASLSFFEDSGLVPPQENLVAEFCLFADSKKTTGWVSETLQPVTRRIPYPEEQAIRHCIIKDQMIEMSEVTNFSPIEVLVAMNKRLHEVSCSTNKGKWLFTRLQLERLLHPSDISFLKLTLSHNFRNLITKSTVWVKDKMLGYIYFSVVQI